MSLTLHPIPEAERVAPDDLKSAFEKARPRILGVLFTALAQAIREKPNVKLTRKPRMIGFARVAVAAETALGFKAGEFMAAYQENLDDGVTDVIEASKEAQALLVFMTERREWKGTATDLWKAVVPGASDEPTRVAPSWPQSGRGMTAALTRVAQALRQIGIHYEHLPRADAKGSRWLRVWKVPAQPSESSDPSEARRDAGSSTDGGQDQPSEDSPATVRDSQVPSDGTHGSTVRESGNRQGPSERNTNEFKRSDGADGSDGPAGTLHDADLIRRVVITIGEGAAKRSFETSDPAGLTLAEWRSRILKAYGAGASVRGVDRP